MKRTPIPGGFLLAIEGIDGTGKSTQAKRVAAALEARGLDCILTREPTDGPWGRRLRESAVAGRLSPAEELHAFLEDRREHVNNLIRPGLAAGRIVITDRYYLSTVAYQGALGFDPADLMRRNRSFAVEPHLAILVDLDPVESLRRIAERGVAVGSDGFEQLESLKRVKAIFDGMREPFIARVDGNHPVDIVRDAMLVEFSVRAVQCLADRQDLTPSAKLTAMLAIHGG